MEAKNTQKKYQALSWKANYFLSNKASNKIKIIYRVFVSTDDQEIAKISESYGAEIPFIRSDKLSDDFTPVTKVMSDTIKWMNKNNLYSENICCILPTTPCISAKDQ